MASYDDAYAGYHRVQTIDPYRPGRTELIGTSSGDASSVDVGKAVKLSGAGVVLATDGDEIYGFVESVNAGTSNGYSVGTVLCDSGNEMYATDAGVGTSSALTVGDLAVASTQTALGTAIAAATGTPVKVAAGSEAGKHQWQVVAVYTTPAGGVLLRKL
jgi:hypothetical protein